ncbi:MAG: phage tail assembly chaperone [Hyphomicrobium sp.]|nr:phage tail assembly chaperone [Hyphomicrobium sp.]
MALGLGALALDPRTFWSMTPREFEAAVRGRFGAIAPVAAPHRRHLDDLMKKFPDREPKA